MAERASISGSKTAKENIDNVASAISQRKVSASDCVQNPPCTTCTILRCKSGSPVSTCATCTFMPERCNLSSIMKTKSPACCPSPLMSSRCPPSILCSSPRCPPRCTVPPRCFRCCEVTGSSPLPTRKVYCDPPICPPSVCSPCSYVKCDPCRPRYEPCCPPLAPCHTPAPAEATPKETTPPPEREMTPEAIRTPEVVKTQSVLVKSQSVLPVSSSHIHRDPCPKSPPPVHRCPSDVEAERPKYFAESITGENTWQMYGVRIHWTDPISPGVSTVKLGTPLTVRLGIEVKPNSCLSADIISAYMWTHMKTQCNPCGTWKDLPLHFQPSESSVGECGIKRYVYSSTLTPTESDTFRLTFNIKWGNKMIWANNYGDDNMVGVGDE